MKLLDKDHLKDSGFSNTLHGPSVGVNGGITALRKKERGAHKAAVDEYFQHWHATTNPNDSTEARMSRKDSYAIIARRYYDITSDIFEHVLGKSFHFCRILPGKPLSLANTWHECYLASKLGTRQGQTVLDVGCGIGGPAREIARFTGASIVCLNNNDYQNRRGMRYTAAEGLANQINFTTGDFMQMPFVPGTFDNAYSIEGTSYAPSLQGAYAEIFKMLKPGGKFAVYELIMTDAYDNDNSEHREMRHNLERGLGLTNIAKISEAIAAVKSAGFELEEAEYLACRPNDIPWYYPFTGSLGYVNSIWDASRLLHMAALRSRAALYAIDVSERLGIFPPGFHKTVSTLGQVGDTFVEAGKNGLFTPLFFMVGRKPSLQEQNVSGDEK
ncbi:hypothetical protein PWT90_07003 [Aphanocladium album]|nr:hypothetical protein PWT90_07003 [Aphanocladium album]